MAGVYCPRCQTQVTLEQDGQSCSNCASKLVIAAPDPPHVRRARKAAQNPTPDGRKAA